MKDEYKVELKDTARNDDGRRLRASVDDQRVAAGMGINVNIVFLSTFAFGSGLSGQRE